MYTNNRINLKPGFKVESNARFGAYLFDCPDTHYKSATETMESNGVLKSGYINFNDGIFSIDTGEWECGVYILVYYFRHTTLTHKLILN